MELYFPEPLYSVKEYEINVIDDTQIKIGKEKGFISIDIDECITEILKYDFVNRTSILDIVYRYGVLDEEKDLYELRNDYLICRTAIRLLEYYETGEYQYLLDKINTYFYLNYCVDDSSVLPKETLIQIPSPLIDYFGLYYKDKEFLESGVFVSQLPFFINFPNLTLVYKPEMNIDISCLNETQKKLILGSALYHFNNWLTEIKTSLVALYDGKTTNIWSSPTNLLDAIKNRIVFCLEKGYILKKCKSVTCNIYFWTKKNNIKKIYHDIKCTLTQLKRDERARDGHPFRHQTSFNSMKI